MEKEYLSVNTDRGELLYRINGNESITMKNARTLDRYWELYNLQPTTADRSVFFAFGQKQFDEAMEKKKKSGLIADGEKIYSGGAGLYGTHSGITSFLRFYDEKDKLIKAECDPQEVYFFEYNNHESFYSWEGDLETMKIIFRIWGEDVARKIVRYSAVYSIENIKERDF